MSQPPEDWRTYAVYSGSLAAFLPPSFFLVCDCSHLVLLPLLDTSLPYFPAPIDTYTHIHTTHPCDTSFPTFYPASLMMNAAILYVYSRADFSAM